MKLDCILPYRDDILQVYAEHFRLANDVAILSDELLSELHKLKLKQGDLSLYRRCLLAFYYKACESYLSICTLLGAGLNETACAVARVLLDSTVQTKWVAGGSEVRAQAVVDSGLIDEYEYAERTSADDDLDKDVRRTFAEVARILEKEYSNTKARVASAENRGERSNALPPRGIRRLLINTDLDHFLVPYRLFSKSIHTSSDDITTFFNEDGLVIGPPHDEELIPRVLTTTSELLLIQIEILSQEFLVEKSEAILRLRGRIGELSNLT